MTMCGNDTYPGDWGVGYAPAPPSLVIGSALGMWAPTILSILIAGLPLCIPSSFLPAAAPEVSRVLLSRQQAQALVHSPGCMCVAAPFGKRGHARYGSGTVRPEHGPVLLTTEGSPLLRVAAAIEADNSNAAATASSVLAFRVGSRVLAARLDADDAMPTLRPRDAQDAIALHQAASWKHTSRLRLVLTLFKCMAGLRLVVVLMVAWIIATEHPIAGDPKAAALGEQCYILGGAEAAKAWAVFKALMAVSGPTSAVVSLLLSEKRHPTVAMLNAVLTRCSPRHAIVCVFYGLFAMVNVGLLVSTAAADAASGSLYVGAAVGATLLHLLCSLLVHDLPHAVELAAAAAARARGDGAGASV